MEKFVACFAEVVDPRQDNARHDLHELLMIALCTVLSGGADCSDMALFGEHFGAWVARLGILG
jgi:DDE_Tnp_1-associated